MYSVSGITCVIYLSIYLFFGWVRWSLFLAKKKAFQNVKEFLLKKERWCEMEAINPSFQICKNDFFFDECFREVTIISTNGFKIC